MEEEIKTKICSRCKRILPLMEFSRSKSIKSGFHSACKKCERESLIKKHPEINHVKNSNSDPDIRICKECKKEKHISEFENYKSGSRIKTRTVCKDCTQKYQIIKTKKCIKCGIEKSLSEFSINVHYIDGKDSRCKECVNNYNKQYYVDNSNNIRSHVNEYRNANRLIVKERKRKYHYKNKERINKHSREYYIANKERLNEYSRNNYQQNKERYKDSAKRYLNTPEGKASKARAHHNRRSKNKNVKNTLTARQWDKILYDQQNNRCDDCKTEFDENRRPTKDHIIPLRYAWFGLTFGNIRALCKSCNSRRKKYLFLGNAIDNLLVDSW